MDETTVVSVDFDFWLEVKNLEAMDWGFREAPFWINHMWAFRAMDAWANDQDLREIARLTHDELPPAQFANWCKSNGWKIRKNQIAFSESHAAAYHWFKRLNNLHLVHIDAHHDCGYHLDELNCDNWVWHLAKAGKLRKVTLIYPKWRLRECNEWEESGEKAAKKFADKGVEIDVHYGLTESLPKDIKVRKMFICRSGAWVPPWMDIHFLGLLRGFMAQGHDSLPSYGQTLTEMLDRDIDWDRVEREGAKMRKMFEKVRADNGRLGN